MSFVLAFLLNADKPHLWKGDIATRVDQFKDWVIRPGVLDVELIRVTRHQHHGGGPVDAKARI